MVIMIQHKKIVDEVSGWLRLYDDGLVDRTWTGPPEVKFMAEPVPPHEEFIDGVATRDIITGGEDNGYPRVRLYLPEKNSGEKEKLPILLHFHGGGFCISEPDWFMYYQFYTRFARSARVICVSPFLRRAPENRLPAAIDDGFSALLWLQSVAKGDTEESWLQKHGDFSRVFLIGDSSGGNLVHEVAARASNVSLDPLRLVGGIPIHPGFLRSSRSRSELEKPQSPFLTLDMLDKFLSLALPLGSNKDHPITCPMGSNAPPLSGLKLPPFLLCLAEMDLIMDTEMEYYEAMKKANKDVELFVSKGMTHSFYLNKIAVDMDPNTAAQTEFLIAKAQHYESSNVVCLLQWEGILRRKRNYFQRGYKNHANKIRNRIPFVESKDSFLAETNQSISKIMGRYLTHANPLNYTAYEITDDEDVSCMIEPFVQNSAMTTLEMYVEIDVVGSFIEPVQSLSGDEDWNNEMEAASLDDEEDDDIPDCDSVDTEDEADRTSNSYSLASPSLLVSPISSSRPAVGVPQQTGLKLDIFSKSLPLLGVLESFAMGAVEDHVNNTSGATQNPANDKVGVAEIPVNVKADVAENHVNDKEGLQEITVKDKADCLPREAKEILKSLASKWENVVDVNALEVIPLKGAMTNEVFQIKWQTTAGESSRKVLVRIYGEGTDIFFDRDVEIQTFECISKNGQGPRLLGRFANGRIEEFIRARTLSASDPRDASISALIAAKMKGFHDLDMPGPKNVYLWDRLRKWLGEAKRLSSPEEVETFHLDTIDMEISILEKELSGTHLHIGFCHNDLQYGNIMLDEETNSMTIIDYEYASYNPVAYDIANHFSEMAADYHTETPHILDYSKYPDLEERQRFVRTYLSSSSQQPSDGEVERLVNEVEKYTLANHLLWGLWGIISEHVNKIDFDYMEYAKQRFQEYWLRKPYLLKSDESSHHNVTNGEQALTSIPKGKPTKNPVIFRKLKKFFSLSLFRSKHQSKV